MAMKGWKLRPILTWWQLVSEETLEEQRLPEDPSSCISVGEAEMIGICTLIGGVLAATDDRLLLLGLNIGEAERLLEFAATPCFRRGTLPPDGTVVPPLPTESTRVTSEGPSFVSTSGAKSRAERSSGRSVRSLGAQLKRGGLENAGSRGAVPVCTPFDCEVEPGRPSGLGDHLGQYPLVPVTFGGVFAH